MTFEIQGHHYAFLGGNYNGRSIHRHVECTASRGQAPG